MTNKIFALTANKENLQAPLFEELDDSETSKIVGGFNLTPRPAVDLIQEISTYGALINYQIEIKD